MTYVVAMYIVKLMSPAIKIQQMCTVLRSTFQCPRNVFDDNKKKESSARDLQMVLDFGQQLLICVRVLLETTRASDISQTRNKFNS